MIVVSENICDTFVFQEIDWNNQWHPRIVFFNALEIEKMQKGHYLFYEEGNDIPYALETYRIKGSFRENLELWDFPLDYQVWIFSIPYMYCKVGSRSYYIHIATNFITTFSRPYIQQSRASRSFDSVNQILCYITTIGVNTKSLP